MAASTSPALCAGRDDIDAMHFRETDAHDLATLRDSNTSHAGSPRQRELNGDWQSCVGAGNTEADKGYAAVLILPPGPQWTQKHNRVRVVPWQHELSKYSGSFHTDLPDASSGKPAVHLDAVGAATFCAPTENTGTTATMEASSGEFEDIWVSIDPGACASEPVDAPEVRGSF
ncbi:hypothetical protein MRX96_050676 [Rhipicephalus microplus]